MSKKNAFFDSLESLSPLQVHLSTEKLGQSVDECGALLKKHEAFERLIVSQEEKVSCQINPSVLSRLILQSKPAVTHMSQHYYCFCLTDVDALLTYFLGCRCRYVK